MRSHDSFLTPPDKAQCLDLTLAQNILNAFDENNFINSTISCHSRIWKIYTCTNGLKSICVDCDNPCSTLCSSTKLTISSNYNKEECEIHTTLLPNIQHVRAIGFGFQQKYPAPLVTDMTLISHRYSIQVNIDVEYDGTIFCGAFRTLANDAILHADFGPHIDIEKQNQSTRFKQVEERSLKELYVKI